MAKGNPVNWAALARRLGSAAPAIGTALGGPLGATVGAVIADRLGVAPTPTAVAEAIRLDPDAMVRLAEIEAEMQAAAIADVREVREAAMVSPFFMRFTAFLAAALLLIYAGALYYLATSDAPNANSEAFEAQLKVLEYLLIAAFSFFFGSSVGSKLKGPISQ